MSNPSPASTNRARWVASRLRAQKECRDYRLIFNRPDHVRFYFGGYEIDFKRDEAMPHRIYYTSGYQFPFLTLEDHAWLFTKAEEYMKAAEAAIRYTQSQQKKHVSKKAPTTVPCTRNLFHHLPIQRKPGTRDGKKS